ncbi:MAG: tripartite tricarboxylate transporter TctB family protein [Rhodospirillales bacterium]|nr:tripartite tricarboxylate transporter TctB family protein [Rhodospirillales bacterium]
MPRINRDVIAASFLVALTCVFFAASFGIRATSYGTVGSEVWPRAILVALGALCLLYLVNSLRGFYDTDEVRANGGGLIGWVAKYRNALWCFAMYALFLITLPYLGILVGGILFVFIVLNLMGGWRPARLAVHGAIAVGSMGVMWSIFTFGLRVILPEGELFRFW